MTKAKIMGAAELSFLSSLSVVKAHVHNKILPPPSSNLLKTSREGFKPKAKDKLHGRRKKVET